MDFKDIIKEIKGELNTILGTKFEDLKSESKKDITAFINAMKEKLERWATLLKEGKLTPEDFEWLVKSQKDMVALKALYATGVSKIKLGHLKNKILSTVVDKVLGIVL